MTERLLIEALDRLAANGKHVDLWLRDDDCIEPSDALDAFLGAAARHQIPSTLAVIPAHTGEALAKRLEREPDVLVTMHGWSHENHAPQGVKKRELGLDRPIDVVEKQLQQGLEMLTALHGRRFFPMLVPPWNRIDPAVVALLPALGYCALSTFGPEKAAAVPMLNTHVDVIDWHGTRGGRDAAVLFAETAAICRPGAAIGVLTHHLVHDGAVADFLERLFSLTTGHPGCRWRSAADILASPAFPADQKT
ncbi:polysaccharide deacetylase family protein [Neorhizobium sp. JUb45]|uniref:polysaccharide deacetylase family protein n=1 Tax=unclassified Neorhizobium TaxID=2629175 RepID=UPI001043F9CF|nr:polysaccharide deacetylase family protein [Neorhizobium sp. JUb45]TCQ99746.1 polysaccharide deacetylase [Neorhizobium sp. JUb45]